MAFWGHYKTLCVLLIIFSIFFPLNVQTHTRSRDVVINDFSYKIYGKETFTYFNMTEQYRNKRKSIHLAVEFAKTIVAFDVQLTLSKYREKNSPFPLFSANIEGCQLLDRNVKNRIFKVIANAIQYGASTFPQSCPMLANKPFVIDQFYVHPEDFPFVNTDLRILANSSWRVEKKMVFSIFLDVSAKSN